MLTVESKVYLSLNEACQRAGISRQRMHQLWQANRGPMCLLVSRPAKDGLGWHRPIRFVEMKALDVWLARRTPVKCVECEKTFVPGGSMFKRTCSDVCAEKRRKRQACEAAKRSYLRKMATEEGRVALRAYYRNLHAKRRAEALAAQKNLPAEGSEPLQAGSAVPTSEQS